MNEPFVKSTVIDQTGGITSVANTESLNIGTIINSKTGPTDRVTLNNLNDLIKYYMIGDSFSSTDDVTIQHIGALLTSSPVDVIRVDSTQLREGIGSAGSRVWFDTNFNLLNTYTNMVVSAADSNNLPSIVYIAGVSNNSVPILYWAGTESEIPAKFSSYTKVNITDSSSENGVDIDAFFRVFTSVTSATMSNDISVANDAVISNDETTAIFNFKVTEISDSLFNVVLNQYNSQLWRSQLPQAANGSQILLGTGNYLEVGDYTLYLNTGVEATSQWTNPIPLPATAINSGAKLPASVFYALCVDYIQQSSNIQSLTGYLSTNKILVSNGTFRVSDSLSDYVSVSDGAATFTSTLTEISDYYIQLTFNGVTYVFGDSAGLSNFNSSNVKIEIKAKTLAGLYAETYLGILNNVPNSAVSVVTSNDTYLYYDNSILPVFVANLVGYNSTETYTDGTSVTHMTTATNSAAYKYDSLWIFIDGTLFYTGATLPSEIDASKITTKVQMSTSSVSIDEFKSLLAYNLSSIYPTAGYTSTGYIINGEYPVTYTSANIPSDDSVVKYSNNLTVLTRIVDQTVYPDLFAVVSAFPCTTKLFSYSYSKDTSKEGQYELSLNYKTNSSEYTISFDAAAIDGYGNSIYYDTVINSNNDINEYFRIVQLSGDKASDSYTSPAFGNSQIIQDPKAADYITALQRYTEYEDKYYSYLWDAGYSAPSLVTAGVRVATAINSEFIPSFPLTYTKKSQFKSYRDGTSVDDPRVYWLGPANKQTVLGNFVSTLSGSLSFLRNKINLYNTGSNEFAPPFGPNYGSVSTGSLTANMSKSDREELLDSQINMISNTVNGASINFNLTSQNSTTYLSEEQFMYLTNIIAHIADSYGDNLIGETNNDATRRMVETELTELIRSRIIANKTPTVTAFRVVCNDPSLNTNAVVEARQIKYQVWVQYTPTIAYVLAYTVVKRLGSF